MPNSRTPAIFFDRDGVLNVDTRYLYKKEEFKWVDGAPEAIRFAKDQGYLTFVITNQSGVARGYYQEEDVRALHEWMNQELEQHGAHIDAFFYCPHHTRGKIPAYTMDCDCRKPKTGMIAQARGTYDIDMERSILIGDKASDMECAKNAGIRGEKFSGGNLYHFLKALIF